MGRPCARSSRFPGRTSTAVEDLAEPITRGDPASVKAVPAIALVLALLFAAPARAARVTGEASCAERACTFYVEYTAARGEENALAVSNDERLVTFADVVPVTAGKG